MTRIIQILIISAIPILSLAQKLEWAEKIGGSHSDNCYDIAHDLNGNIYLSGGFSNSVNFNPFGSPIYLNSSNADNSDIFIAKYDPNLILKWVIGIGNNEWEMGLSLEIDSLHNVYISGNYNGNVDFDPGPNTYYLNTQFMSYFLAKYNSAGELEWAKDIGSDGNNYLTVPYRTRLFIDNNENVFSFLHENDTLKKYDPISGDPLLEKHISGFPILLNKSKFAYIEHFKTPVGYEYFYQDSVRLCLFDVDNSNQNSYLIGQTNDGYIGGFIEEGQKGEILLSGSFWGTINFFGYNDTIKISNYSPIAKRFIAKIDTSGNTIWAKDNIYFDPRPYMIKTNSSSDIFSVQSNFIAKYDSSLNFLAYSPILGGSGNDFIGGFELYSDTVIICGHFYNTIDIDLTDDNYYLSTSPPKDIFVAKYSNFDITTNAVSTKGMPIESNKIKVYPNPSNGTFNIQFESNNNNTTIFVHDIYGRNLVSLKSYGDYYKLDMTHYENGIYFLTAFQGNEVISMKLVKQE